MVHRNVDEAREHHPIHAYSVSGILCWLGHPGVDQCRARSGKESQRSRLVFRKPLSRTNCDAHHRHARQEDEGIDYLWMHDENSSPRQRALLTRNVWQNEPTPHHEDTPKGDR